MTFEEQIAKLQEYVDDAEKIVFFGGAGVSTESGVPDCRSVDRLYNQKYKFPPETILSHSFYLAKKEDFYEYYFDKLLVPGIKPNAAHKVLAEMEKKGKLSSVITQNIDGLHQMAGSRKVLELHGSVHRNYCEKCHEFYDGEYMLLHKDEGVPKCKICGGDIKPDVVLYEEALDQDVIMETIKEISSADLLIVGGTSLVVYPAAGFIDYFQGKHIVVINKSETARDKMADLVIHESIGKTLESLKI
jgi:NAD-dependent deacetylase